MPRLAVQNFRTARRGFDSDRNKPPLRLDDFRAGRGGNEAVGNVAAGHPEAHQHSIVVDSVQGSLAGAVRVIHFLERALVPHESMNAAAVGVSPHNLSQIVEAQSRGSRRTRKVQRGQGSSAEQEAMAHVAAVNVEAGHGLRVVDPGCLCSTRGRWNYDLFKHATLFVVDIRMKNPVGVCVVAGCLVKIISAQQLVQRGARKVDVRELAEVVQKTMLRVGLIDVETGSAAVVVDADYLRLRRARVILADEMATAEDDESLIDARSFVAGNFSSLLMPSS